MSFFTIPIAAVGAQKHSRLILSRLRRRRNPYADADECVINTWVRNQRSEHTRGVYRRNAGKLLSFTGKPLRAITLEDLHAFAAELAGQGLKASIAGTHSPVNFRYLLTAFLRINSSNSA